MQIKKFRGWRNRWRKRMELKAYMVGGSDSEAGRVIARTASFSEAIDKEQMWILCKIACVKMVSRFILIQHPIGPTMYFKGNHEFTPRVVFVCGYHFCFVKRFLINHCLKSGSCIEACTLAKRCFPGNRTRYFSSTSLVGASCHWSPSNLVSIVVTWVRIF